jgi:signal transduction histidine kinase
MTEVRTGPADASPGSDGQVQLLLQLVQEINAGATLESVFSLVAGALRQVFDIDRFAIVLVQKDGSLRLTKSQGLSDSYLAFVREHVNEGSGARALAQRKPLYIRDAPQSPDFWPMQEAAAIEGFHTVLVWPLFSGSEPLGYLIMYHNTVRDYTTAEITLAQAMAQQAALAVQHNRLLAQAEVYRTDLEERFRRRAAEVEAIDDIVLRISSSLDLDSTLQSIMEAAVSLAGAHTGSLYLLSEDGQYRAVAAHGVALDQLRQVVLTMDNGLLAEMCRTGEPVVVSDFPEQVHTTMEARSLVARTRTRATLGVPLMQGASCLGALYVASTDRTPFSPEAVHVMRRLGSFAEVAVQNARRFSNVQAERSRLALEQERSRTSLLSKLLDLSVLLNSDLSTQVLMERVVEAAMGLVGASAGTLGLVEGQRLVFRRFHQPSGWADFTITLEPGQGVPGHVWRTREPYVCNDCRADPRVLRAVQERIGFERLVYVPIFNRAGALIGTLGAYDPVPEREFGQQDVEVLQMLAHQAAIALENAQLNGMKDDFLSIVSHELKTPVTSIKGFAQVLQRRLTPESLEQGSRYLDIINAQADRLTSLINDLLDLSRIQTGRFVFDTHVLNYTALIMDVLDELRLVNSENPIVLDAPDRVMVIGNENRLRQVLINLVDNAVKHGPSGREVRLAVDVGEEVTTYVCDEGEGLPADEAEQIFAPYYQVRHPSDRYSKGLGLGLFISRRIVEEHGGRIWLDGVDHTSFVFTLQHAAEAGDAAVAGSTGHTHDGHRRPVRESLPRT